MADDDEKNDKKDDKKPLTLSFGPHHPVTDASFIANDSARADFSHLPKKLPTALVDTAHYVKDAVVLVGKSMGEYYTSIAEITGLALANPLAILALTAPAAMEKAHDVGQGLCTAENNHPNVTNALATVPGLGGVVAASMVACDATSHVSLPNAKPAEAKGKQ